MFKRKITKKFLLASLKSLEGFGTISNFIKASTKFILSFLHKKTAKHIP
jgi:hypothetical protein